MIILGIDPGYDRLGVAIIEKKDNKEKVIFSHTFETDRKEEFIQRMFLVANYVRQIIDKYNPQYLSIEKLFFNTNQKTATNVAEVRGAIIFVAKDLGLEVFEYTPLEIKTAITGYGRSDKKQVLFLLQKIINIDKEIEYDDE